MQLVARDLRDDPRALRAAHVAVNAGYRVTAVCMLPAGRPPTPVQGVRVVAARGGGLSLRIRSGAQTGSVSGPRVRDLRALWRVGRQLAWAARVVMRREPADIVHAHDLETLAAGLAMAGRGRLIYDAHELYADWEPSPSPLYLRYCLLLERAAARRAFAWVTVGDAIADVLSSRYGVQPKVVLNVPELTRTPVPAGPAEEGFRPRALYQGVYARDRGLEAVVDAARLVPEIEIALRGFGPLEAELRARARDSVTFLAPAEPDDLVNALSGAQIGLVPYLPTTLNNTLCMPNKLFEYLAGGLAVAASDLPELRRVVAGVEAGEVFAPGEPVEIARALRALADPNRLADAQAHAAAAAAGRFAWDSQATILRNIYERACAA